MKKFQIVAIVVIIAAIAIISQMTSGVSTYATFDMAKDGQKVKITGEMSKSKAMEYRPDIDPNIFKFFLKDSEGVEKQVVLAKAKPQDIERAESIVLTGFLKDDTFYASEILTKCPSKYKDEEIALKEGLKS